MAKEIGGENNMNDKTLEWPSDEYLDGLTQQEFDDLQITSIEWIVGTLFGRLMWKTSIWFSLSLPFVVKDGAGSSDRIKIRALEHTWINASFCC